MGGRIYRNKIPQSSKFEFEFLLKEIFTFNVRVSQIELPLSWKEPMRNKKKKIISCLYSDFFIQKI